MKKILITLLLLFFVTSAQAELVVIGNLKNNLQSLTIAQVEAIFMGRTRFFPDGRIIFPLSQSSLRSEFYAKLTSKPIEHVNAYWAQIMLTGLVSPPFLLANDEAVLLTVNENRNAIGYIDKKNADKSVRILLILN